MSQSPRNRDSESDFKNPFFAIPIKKGHRHLGVYTERSVLQIDIVNSPNYPRADRDVAE